MRRFMVLGSVAITCTFACSSVMTGQVQSDHRSVIQYDSTVAVREGGPHNGGGQTTAYQFFANQRDFQLVFRKRALHPGSAIGYHRNEVDEIYYVLSGRGELTLDGTAHMVGPGAAILTRAGSSHGLRQVGAEDLVIIINYEPTRT
jgi:mannose-6-phosphate isomerase-like protein (cupin superfamily)